MSNLHEPLVRHVLIFVKLITVWVVVSNWFRVIHVIAT